MGFYQHEYGNKKGFQALGKIESSQRIQKFITRLRVEKLSPGEDGFIIIINSIPYFFFSKGETTCYGALYAIKKWIDQSLFDTFQLSEQQIKDVIIATIFRTEKTKTHISGKPNFFDNYYTILESIIERDRIAHDNLPPKNIEEVDWDNLVALDP
jgi:hypothetical protein